MQWTKTAEAAHGAAVAAVKADVARRFGDNTALLAEDEAEYVLEAHAEDLATDDAAALGIVPLVTAAHVRLAASAYQYTPSLAQRITGIAWLLAAIVTRTERTA